ncbi:hypothetical protein CRG98_042058 [Punica granatum]|uniref:Uncharacterized protein n=1 Tax=Punica granatum TaxID=22663 RepID=A0A2I0I0Q5_PUNGR|nr:hypothetical protein CRG98_042058 [Punica granatum]
MKFQQGKRPSTWRFMSGHELIWVWMSHFSPDSLPVWFEILASPLQLPITGTVAPRAAPPEPDQFRQRPDRPLSIAKSSVGLAQYKGGVARGATVPVIGSCKGGARVSSRMGRELGEGGDTRTRTRTRFYPNIRTRTNLVTTHKAPRQPHRGVVCLAGIPLTG